MGFLEFRLNSKDIVTRAGALDKFAAANQDHGRPAAKGFRQAIQGNAPQERSLEKNR
jgi:hypothetical protein